MNTPDDPTPKSSTTARFRPPRKTLVGGVVALCLVASAIVVVTSVVGGHSAASPASAAGTSLATPTASATSIVEAPTPPKLSAAAVAALPAARYDTVVGGLLAFHSVVATDADQAVYHLRADAPLFGGGRTRAVARLEAKDFLGVATTVVGVRSEGDWELVLTPARRILPSKAAVGEVAAAQTAAWVPSADLIEVATPTQRVVISTARQTISIVDADGAVAASYPAGVGTPNTPTPMGVTGYLEERYVDPSQGTGTHPIQLTSLHSSAADEPYGGSDGGLIGVHYEAQHTGAVSHGCVRLDAAALAAVDALPLGTLVTVE